MVMMDTAKDQLRLRDSFLFANTLQFLHYFGALLGLDSLTPIELEELLLKSIEGEAEGDTSIFKFFKAVVKNLHRSKAPSDEFMTQMLSREYRRHTLAPPPSFLEPALDGPRKLWPPLASLTPSMRLQVLYDLCSFTLFDLETLMTRPNMQDLGPRWRLEAIGNDKHGLRYWFLADRWLFSENPHRPQTKAKSTRKGPRNREEEEAADDSEEEWKCVAWDSASWHAFLDDNPFARSRKASDREILRRFREEIYPVAEPLILEEERRRRVVWKKEQAEIQRLALFESRKRSSRLAAKEKIRAELQMEELPLARLATTKAPKGREKRPLSREERVALRNQKIAKMEETILTAALEQSSRDLDPVDVEDVEEEEEAGEFGECGDDEELEATERFLDEQHHRSAEDSDDYESLGLGLGLEQQSPIKLIVRKGPEGQLNAQVFIGNEMLEKEDLGERAAVLDENTPASPKRGQADGTSEPGIESERISAVVAAGEPFPSSASASVPVPVCSPEVSKIDVASLLTDFANAIQ